MTTVSFATIDPSTSETRASDFHPVDGGPEMRSGEQLLVEAYALIWLLLLAWLVIVWRKQNAVSARLRDLEAAIDRAERGAPTVPNHQGPGSPAPTRKAGTTEAA